MGSEGILPLTIIFEGLKAFLEAAITHEPEIEQSRWNTQGREFPDEGEAVGELIMRTGAECLGHIEQCKRVAGFCNSATDPAVIGLGPL